MTIEPGSPYLDTHVDGTLQNHRQWVKLTTQNVDQYYFGDFIESILYKFESHPASDDLAYQRTMFWDNLSFHKTAFVINNTAFVINNI